MGWSAFSVQSKTLTIAVTPTTSTPLQCPQTGNRRGVNYRVSNATAQGCWLVAGANSSAFAEVGVAGTLTHGHWIAGNATVSFSGNADAWFSAIVPAATTTTLYINTGDGI